MRQKTRLLIYILIAIAAVIMGTLAILQNHHAADKPVTAQERIDLGMTYLLDLSYEKAVLEFTEAIEIEPLNPDAYLGLAEAYVGMGDIEKAVEVLENGYDKTGDGRLKAMLEELMPETEKITTIAVEETRVTTETLNTVEISDDLTNVEKTVELYIPSSINVISDLPDDCFSGGYFKKYGKYELNLDLNQGCVTAYFVQNDYIGGSVPIQINNWKNIYKILLSESPMDGMFHKIAEPAVNVYNINGDVIQTGENIYNENGKLIKAISYGSDGSVLMSKDYEYDENENLIKETSQSGYTVYSYNSDGKILSIASYNNDGKETIQSTYTYDTNGNIKTSQNFTSTITYECDLNGNIKKCHYINENVNILDEYNSNGKKVKREDYSNGKNSTTTYLYDSFDRLVKSQYYGNTTRYGGEYGEEGTIIKNNGVMEYSYNDNGDLIKKIGTDEISGKRISKYEYDSQNRLIKEEDDNGLGYEYFYNDCGLMSKIDWNGYSEVYTYVKIELPKAFADQIKEEYGIDLTE